MESIKKLMLRIEGGETNEPLKTLLNVGNVPDNMRLAPSLISLDQSWRIVHAQMFTAYGLWSPATTSRGTTGHLQITLFVPPMQQLANSTNPLDVLNAVIDLMGIKDSHGLRLPNMTLDSVQFERLLNKYDLVERPMPLPVMAGKVPGTFCVSNETQLRALMRFSRYPELAKVSQLELGYNCATTININTKVANKPTKNGGKSNKPPQQVDTPPPLDGPTEESQPLTSGFMGGRSLDTPQQGTPQNDPLFAMGVSLEQNEPSTGDAPAGNSRQPQGPKKVKSSSTTPTDDETPPRTNGFIGGRSLDDDPPTVNNKPFNTDGNNGKKNKKNKKNKKKWWKIPLIILGIIFLLFIIMGIVGVIINNKTNNTSFTSDSTEMVAADSASISINEDTIEQGPDEAQPVKSDEAQAEDIQKQIEEITKENEEIKKQIAQKKEQIEEIKEKKKLEFLEQGKLQQILDEDLATPEQARWIKEILSAKNNTYLQDIPWKSNYDDWEQVKFVYKKIQERKDELLDQDMDHKNKTLSKHNDIVQQKAINKAIDEMFDK